MNPLSALRHRHLAILWSSQVFSALGDHLYEIAVMWIAVQVAGGGAGIVGAAEALPALLFGVLGGVYADRWDRRRAMIVVDLIRAGAVLILPALAAVGPLQLWHLVLVSVVVSSLGALFTPALQASLPMLAGNERTLQATNGLMDATRRLARAIGPSLAGVLAGLLPLPHFFTLDSVTFGISAIALFSLSKHFAWRPEQQLQEQMLVMGIWADILGALRAVHTHPSMAFALLGVGLVNVSWGMAFTVGVPLLADQVLTGGVGTYGLIVGAFGVGNVVSNLVVGGMTIRRRMFAISSGRLVLGIGLLLMGNAPSIPVAMFAACVASVGGPMGEIPLLTMLQTDFPTEQIGKIYSLRMVAASGGGLVGLLLAPFLFAHLAVPIAISLAAIGVILVGALGLARFGTGEIKVSRS